MFRGLMRGEEGSLQLYPDVRAEMSKATGAFSQYANYLQRFPLGDVTASAGTGVIALPVPGDQTSWAAQVRRGEADRQNVDRCESDQKAEVPSAFATRRTVLCRPAQARQMSGRSLRVQGRR